MTDRVPTQSRHTPDYRFGYGEGVAEGYRIARRETLFAALLGVCMGGVAGAGVLVWLLP